MALIGLGLTPRTKEQIELDRQELRALVNKVLLAAADNAHELEKQVGEDLSPERAYHTWVLNLVESIKDVYR